MTTGSSGGDPPAAPPQRPIGEAAGAPIGPRRATKADKTVDTAAVIVAPMLVPAGLLATIRTDGDHSFLSSFTLSEFAFGVVAVAFAALVRAITGKGEAWKLVVTASVIVMVFETALAIKDDVVADSEALAEQGTACNRKCDFTAVHEIASRIVESQASTMHWLVAIVSGCFLCVIAAYAIWSEA